MGLRIASEMGESGSERAVSTRIERVLTLGFLACDDCLKLSDAREAATGWIARGGQSNSMLLIEGLRKAGLPE
jgi:hypothetical protein